MIVQIAERKPAAFVKLPAESMVRWALIDEEGVILDPPAKASFRLPVLAGVMGGESQEKRGIRVRRMQRLMKELGPLADNVSEVDASDLDDLKITEQAGRRRRVADAGRSQFFFHGSRTSWITIRTFIAKCRRRRRSICGSTIASRVWRRRAMPDKSQLAVGLDLGKRVTRAA